MGGGKRCWWEDTLCISRLSLKIASIFLRTNFLIGVKLSHLFHSLCDSLFPHGQRCNNASWDHLSRSLLRFQYFVVRRPSGRLLVVTEHWEHLSSMIEKVFLDVSIFLWLSHSMKNKRERTIIRKVIQFQLPRAEEQRSQGCISDPLAVPSHYPHE